MIQTFKADNLNERLDVFLTRMRPDFSRAHIQRLIAEGCVLVGGVLRKGNFRLKLEDEVSLEVPDAKNVEILPENIPLDILYEDNDIIVINKARGMVVHPAAGISSGTLVNALLYHCRDLSGINGEIRPGIVHRLDKDTSGVMVAAKNDKAHISLAKQIQDKTAHRTYIAIVWNNIKEEAGIIRGDIGRHPTDRKKMAIVQDNGKPAVTHFKVLERFGDCTLVECRLETGRTHQIRVHMTHIGHPLVGDPKYGAAKHGKIKGNFAIQGQALHSVSLELTHPTTGERMKFTSPVPDDMEKILNKLRNK
ncbi:RluA family pseudouridine synthase [Anaerovibrio sp.]|uniref:RluA family pseudouridine synthase n=1 Tax=Anaerovibrio sp. TaxID=1872532 RepID=UPI001B61A637|nr:RluA family pseudouridine synthase [Anaerovibrio sp.]MBP3231084.1 RluA family pseudouridine synthase [Anaerovibrio sp.]MBR2143035.1 RluA family pseudouridine synthase [Anaerovibrio sp.]